MSRYGHNKKGNFAPVSNLDVITYASIDKDTLRRMSTTSFFFMEVAAALN